VPLPLPAELAAEALYDTGLSMVRVPATPTPLSGLSIPSLCLWHVPLPPQPQCASGSFALSAPDCCNLKINNTNTDAPHLACVPAAAHPACACPPPSPASGAPLACHLLCRPPDIWILHRVSWRGARSAYSVPRACQRMRAACAAAEERATSAWVQCMGRTAHGTQQLAASA